LLFNKWFLSFFLDSSSSSGRANVFGLPATRGFPRFPFVLPAPLPSHPRSVRVIPLFSQACSSREFPKERKKVGCSTVTSACPRRLFGYFGTSVARTLVECLSTKSPSLVVIYLNIVKAQCYASYLSMQRFSCYISIQ
jgi:hypothetical protein